MQKYEKSAEIYQLPREGRSLVKNDYDVVSNSKKQNYGGRKLNRMIKDRADDLISWPNSL